MNDEDMNAVFRQEASDLVEALERGLLDLEDAPDDMGVINSVFRILHTIKGSGAMFGFTDLAAFVHEFETAFDRIRAGAAQVSPSLIRIALRARDEIVGLLVGEEDADGRRAAILAELETAVARRPGAASPRAGAAASPADDTSPAVLLRFRLAGAALALGGRPDLLLDELRELGAVNIRADISRVPALDLLDPNSCALGWTMFLPGGITDEQIEGVFMFHDAEVQCAPVVAQPAPQELPVDVRKAVDAVVPAVAAPDKAGATMRVAAERLDRLMDRVGELVIADARLGQLAAQSRDPALMAAAEEINRLASGLRDTTMRIRMVPLKSMVGRFRRLIHGLSETLGKPIDFVVIGEDTELDKTVIEQLADPLVHVLRNSVDHGLETPAERLAAGKPADGRIELSAEYSGAEVLIRVRDDGRGLNLDRIRAKAVASGLIGADAVLSDAALCALILEPGFSTAATVTELSGRGVGMDVVKKTIEALRGSIELETSPNAGTTVTLRLPLTLAIIEGLLVEVAGERFAIPLSAVQEIVELPAAHTQAHGGADFLDIRERLVPFLRLRQVFGSLGQPDALQTVVIVRSGEARAGVVVDRIIGTSQIVIKQMSRLHVGVRAVSGATILGDGTVALILDVPQLVGVRRAADHPGRELAA